MSIKEEGLDQYPKIRKRMNPLIKKIFSLLFWYGFGLGALVFTVEYIMPIYPGLGTFFGWFDTIAVIITVVDYLLEINNLLKIRYQELMN
jgi:hypothetical protein